MWEKDFLEHLVEDESTLVVKKEEKKDFPVKGTITLSYTISVSEGDYNELNKTAFRNALQVILGRGAEIDHPEYENRQVVITLEKNPISIV